MRRAARSAVVAAVLSVAALVTLGSVGCGGSEGDRDVEATPTLEASTTPATGPTATGDGSETSAATPPVPVATVTVAVAAGPPTQPLLLIEGSTLVRQEIDGTRRVIAEVDAAMGVPAFPAWSPEGDAIAFVARRFFSGGDTDWGDDIYVVAASDGEPELVRPHAEPGEQVFGLAWRPDGERLLLGQIELEIRGGAPVNVAGAAILEFDLTDGSERSVVEDAYDPSLSSDGSRLAYVALGELSTQLSVVAANADGSDPIVLAESGRFEIMRYPRISPDGTTVALTAAAPLVRSPAGGGGRLASWVSALLGPLAPRRAEAHGVPMDLWLLDSRSGALTRLTAIGEDDPYPAWSADGATVVFIGTNGLYEASVGGEPAGPGSAGGGALVRTGEGRFDGQLTVAPRE